MHQWCIFSTANDQMKKAETASKKSEMLAKCCKTKIMVSQHQRDLSDCLQLQLAWHPQCFCVPVVSTFVCSVLSFQMLRSLGSELMRHLSACLNGLQRSHLLWHFWAGRINLSSKKKPIVQWKTLSFDCEPPFWTLLISLFGHRLTSILSSDFNFLWAQVFTADQEHTMKNGLTQIHAKKVLTVHYTG